MKRLGIFIVLIALGAGVFIAHGEQHNRVPDDPDVELQSSARLADEQIRFVLDCLGLRAIAPTFYPEARDARVYDCWIPREALAEMMLIANAEFPPVSPDVSSHEHDAVAHEHEATVHEHPAIEHTHEATVHEHEAAPPPVYTHLHGHLPEPDSHPYVIEATGFGEVVGGLHLEAGRDWRVEVVFNRTGDLAIGKLALETSFYIADSISVHEIQRGTTLQYTGESTATFIATGLNQGGEFRYIVKARNARHEFISKDLYDDAHWTITIYDADIPLPADPPSEGE